MNVLIFCFHGQMDKAYASFLSLPNDFSHNLCVPPRMDISRLLVPVALWPASFITYECNNEQSCSPRYVDEYWRDQARLSNLLIHAYHIDLSGRWMETSIYKYCADTTPFLSVSILLLLLCVSICLLSIYELLLLYLHFALSNRHR